MAITTRYATNTALQYNEVDLTDYIIDVSVGSRLFLTEQPLTRILRATETSALYFITNGSITGGAARYRWYDSGGTLLNEYLLPLTSVGVHNSIPADWESFYVPDGTTRMTVSIVSAGNLIQNGTFALGTGNLFTSWTLTQPSRTNYILRSNDVTNASWGKLNMNTPAANSLIPTATNGAHRIEQDVATIGVSQTMSCRAKENGYSFVAFEFDGQVAYFNLATGDVGTVTGGTARMIADPNDEGYYYCVLSLTPSNTKSYIYVTQVDNVISFAGDTTSGVLIDSIQVENGANITPHIPTTSATVTTSLGEIIQDATGGLESSRCLKLWVNNGGAEIEQDFNQVNGIEYEVSFWARVDVLYGNDYVTGPSAATLLTSTEWTRYTQTFTAVGTITNTLILDFSNDANFGFVYIDDVSVNRVTPSELTQEQTYLLDDSCVAYEAQLNWLNKLGGRDTWVFTGYPVTSKEVNRTSEIEYSRRTNLTSPNRIYRFRQVASRETVTFTHQCPNRATAEWLKSELIDSLDVLVLRNGEYYPCDVVGASIVTANTFSQDYVVRVTLRYAFDINVQTR